MTIVDYSETDLSFAGCGFMCIYHAGVSAALKEYAPQMFQNRIYGASAGAIAAAALICDLCISEATSAILQVLCEARIGRLQAFSPTFDLLGLVRDGMERMLPGNAHILCSGRLFISLTRYDDCKNVVVSQFSSKEDLIQAVLCSCYIPWFCGFEVPSFHGVRYIDGGFSDNQPKMNGRLTVTISPFSGEADICPMDTESASLFDCVFHNTSFRLTTSNFYRLSSCFAPPSQDICSRFCHQGFTDTLRFLTKNAITPCVRCLTIQSNSLSMPTYGMDELRFRRRLNSECGLCLEKLDDSQLHSRELFPKHLQRTLEIVKPSDSRLYNYIRSFRIVRYSLSFLSPVITPANYMLMTLRLLQDWMNSKSKKDFFFERFQEAVDLILKEIEERNLLCTPKFSYRLSSMPKGDLIGAPRGKPVPAIFPTAVGTKRRRNDLAQIYETDDHVEYSAYVNDHDSIAKVIDNAERHNAILAYHYTDATSHATRVYEIFDMDRVVPRAKCHMTARFSDFYKGEPPIATTGATTVPVSLKQRKSLAIPSLAEEREEEPEERSADTPTETRSKEILTDLELSGNSASTDMNSSASATDMTSLSPLNNGSTRYRSNDDVTCQNVPPDPVSVTPKSDESNSSKRDACCSPVRQLNKSLGVSSSTPSSTWRGSAGRLNNTRASNLAVSSASSGAQRNVRRHTTIGTSNIPAWSGGSTRKLLPSASSRSLASNQMSSTSHATASSTRSPMVMPKVGSSCLKTVHSSDSDDEVEDEELFIVGRRSVAEMSAGVTTARKLLLKKSEEYHNF